MFSKIRKFFDFKKREVLFKKQLRVGLPKGYWEAQKKHQEEGERIIKALWKK